MTKAKDRLWTLDEDHLLLFCRSIDIPFSKCADIITREGTVRTKGSCISREYKLYAKGIKYDETTMEK